MDMDRVKGDRDNLDDRLRLRGIILKEVKGICLKKISINN